MKKRKKSSVLQEGVRNNPVAKFAGKFNKAAIFKDKKHYQRQAKHKGLEPFPMTSRDIIGKGSGRIVQSPFSLAQ